MPTVLDRLTILERQLNTFAQRCRSHAHRNAKLDYFQGVYDGYANAYEIAARWIHTLVDEEEQRTWNRCKNTPGPWKAFSDQTAEEPESCLPLNAATVTEPKPSRGSATPNTPAGMASTINPPTSPAPSPTPEFVQSV